MDKYERLAILFGSLKNALYIYAAMLCAMAIIIVAGFIWRLWNRVLTFHDLFGELLLMCVFLVMAAGAVDLRRYIYRREQR